MAKESNGKKAVITKTLKKKESIRHPLAKAKVRVVDSFAPRQGADIRCPYCDSADIASIKITEGDPARNRKCYILTCSACSKKSWFVLAE